MKHHPDPCVNCGVAIRRSSETAAQRPGTRAQGKDGLCDTCARRERRRADGVAARETSPYLRPGRSIELVSWEHTVDGHKPTLVSGTYKKRTREAWFVEIAGATRQLPRKEWEDCVA